MTFVNKKHRHGQPVDNFLGFAEQDALLFQLEASRRKRSVPVARLALAAQVSERTYRRLAAGQTLARASTLARLKAVRKRLAAGGLDE